MKSRSLWMSQSFSSSCVVECVSRDNCRSLVLQFRSAKQLFIFIFYSRLTLLFISDGLIGTLSTKMRVCFFCASLCLHILKPWRWVCTGFWGRKELQIGCLYCSWSTRPAEHLTKPLFSYCDPEDRDEEAGRVQMEIPSLKHTQRRILSICVYYLEYVSFKNVVAQLHGLLAVEFSLLTWKHEGHQSVATSVYQHQ